MLFLRHPGWLWLKKHDRKKLPPIDEGLQAIFDDGHLFEEYADQLFPKAVKIGFSFKNNTYITMPSRTKEAIRNGTEVIFQGRLEAENSTCIFDVLKKVSKKEFDLYEIKSSSEVKEEHILDLAFQTIVLENNGLKIRKQFVIHVNNKYKRKGEINIKELTVQTEITKKVQKVMAKTKALIQEAQKVASQKNPPDFSPRHTGLDAFKEWLEIYYILYPQKNSHNIFKLTRLNAKLVGKLEDLGISLIKDIPDSIKLHPRQKIQVQATKENKQTVNKEKIKEFISQVTYPLYFLDYETFASLIPPFDGLSPRQQVPFQYSIHKIDEQGTLTHMEFLHRENSNPSLSLLVQLKKDIGDIGTVFVWYESFEKTRNKEMGEMFPQYAQFMKELNGRIVDLITPFSSGWFVDKDFFGSASIKKVLPVLIKELSYEKLDIQEGNTASRTWSETVLEGKNVEKKDKIMQNLLEYCCLDTLAM